MHIRSLLSQRIEAAFTNLGLSGQALLQTASRPEFGDYQANGVMAAAKRAGIRAEIDQGGRSLGKQIKISNQEKVSLYAVIGEKEVNERTLSITSRADGDMGSFALDDAIDKMVAASENRAKTFQ